MTTIDEHKPFYREDIFENLNEIVRLTHGEAVGYSHRAPDEYADYSREAADNAQKINKAVNEVCDAIRERISQLSEVS